MIRWPAPLMSEVEWTDGKVSVIGLHPSGNLSISIIKPLGQLKLWHFHVTYDIPGGWDSQYIKLAAYGVGRTKKETIQRASDWYDKLREATNHD